jgi:hypothetical protein
MASILGMEISPISHLPQETASTPDQNEGLPVLTHNNTLPPKVCQPIVKLRLTEWTLTDQEAL